MVSLEQEVSQFIIDTLNLEAVRSADIDPAAPLFDSGLGLDSVDALELATALEKRFGLTLPSEPAEVRAQLGSVRSLCASIERHRAAAGSSRG